MKTLFLFFIICCISSSICITANKKEVVCYIGAWTDAGQKSFDKSLCSIYLIAFGVVNPNTFDLEGADLNGYTSTGDSVALKEQSPDVKLPAGIGGSNANSVILLILARTQGTD